MIKVIICGYKGRMGQMIKSLVDESSDMEYLSGVDIGDDLESSIENCDVIIDFSSPEASVSHCESAARHKKPIIIGTTGFTPDQNLKIKNLAGETPILKSPNMSIGVNMMWNLARIASSSIDWPIQISETHHIHKKDKPSGTALRLSEAVGHEKKIKMFDGEFPQIEQPSDELWICSIRKGEAIGEHEFILKSNDEELKISHKAFDRTAFARGATKAARWIVGKKPGLYDMKDALSKISL